MLELGKFDLQLALGTAGSLREDLKDQFGAIEYTYLPQALKVALLNRRDFMIKEHELCFVSGKQGRNLFGLASADIQLRIGARTMADQAGCHDMTGRLGQRAQLIE
jgi:hypothetical protein